jgi:hypothetical protein
MSAYAGQNGGMGPAHRHFLSRGRPVGGLFCFWSAAERTRLKEKKKQKKKSDNITPYFFNIYILLYYI